MKRHFNFGNVKKKKTFFFFLKDKYCFDQITGNINIEIFNLTIKKDKQKTLY